MPLEIPAVFRFPPELDLRLGSRVLLRVHSPSDYDSRRQSSIPKPGYSAVPQNTAYQQIGQNQRRIQLFSEWSLFFFLSGGWPGLGKLIFVDMTVVKRISLRYLSGKYREAEGAPGSLFEPGSWVEVSFRGVCDAGGIEALLRRWSFAFYYSSVA